MCEQENGSAHDKMSNRDDVTLPDDLSESDDSEPEEEPTSMTFNRELKDLDSSSDDDDDNEVEIDVAPAAGQRAQSAFSLKGGSSGFSSRSHSIFESLDSVAKLASSALGQDNVIDGVFARPPPPPPLISSKAGQPLPRSSASGGKRGVPDYLVHPERWTHYSLEDVAETSNSQNSMVARQYLTSLQQRKQQQEPSSPHLNQGRNTSSSQQKIFFSRPSQPGREQPADELKVAGDKDRSMSLHHLEEEEEEERTEGARAMARRMDRFKEDSMGKSKERGKGISHLDQEDEEEEEEEERRSATRPPEAEERKRKWGQQGGGVKEETEEEKKNQQANPGFVFFRKTNRKKYRKSSEQDND